MEDTFRSENIIKKGKISESDLPESSSHWGVYIFYGLIAIWGLYYVNAKWTEMQLFGSLLMGMFLAYSIYMPFETFRKLNIAFYEDAKPLDYKERLIQRQKEINHWELLKSEKNYYLFFENNLIIQSYYITIVIDARGFYINCYPTKGRILDFGRSQRWSNQLYDDIIACL